MKKIPLKILYTSLLLIFSLLGFAEAQTSAPQIIKSENDNRLYRYVVLPNKMQVLLISDPETDKAAVSLDVKAGSGDDPEDRPGLAHFLEHMLFLGTKKYPKADAYNQFMDRHGGQHNAFTSLEHTNYHFDINPGFLEPAMDRFAQFFIAPLMDAKYVERERKAVHSEFAAKIQDEGRRTWDVYREIFNPNNKSATYGVGNQETLADRGDHKTRDELLTFYNKYYSANLMNLVVLGNQPLDELQSQVEHSFSDIQNKNLKDDKAEIPLFTEGALPARLFIKPLQAQRELSLMFPIPVFESYYREKPVDYIGYLLGHEGEGSLLAVWKQRGWVESLSAGASVANQHSAAFSITASLTEEGYQHIDQMIAETFQMIDLLKAGGIERWRYNEQSVIQSAAFRYQEKGNPLSYVTALANNLHYYPPADVIQGPVLNQLFDEHLIKYFLSYLTPENVLVEIGAQDVKVDKTSRYYQTPYRLEKINKKLSEALAEIPKANELRLPQANEFVAKNFNLKRTSQSMQEKPQLIREQSNLRLWHDQDGVFSVPRSGILIYARSVASTIDVRGAALTDVYVRLLNRHVNDFRYSAALAGLSLGLVPGSRGINISIDGFSDKQGLLLTKALDAVAAPVFDQQDLDKVKEELLRELQNESMKAPYQQLRRAWQSVLSLMDYEEPPYQAAVAGIDLKDVQDFSQKWVHSLNADVLIYGNVTDSDALKLASIIESKLFLGGRLHHDPQALYVNLPASPKVHMYSLAIDHPDVATLHYFQGVDDSIEEQAKMGLLAQVLRADFYNQLRTEQQLGYVVGSGYYPMARVPGLGFVVQSTTHAAKDIDEAVKHFLGESARRVATMPAEQFEQHRAAMLHFLQETPKSLSEQGERWWGDINYRYLGFDHQQQLIEAVSALTQKSLADYYWKTLLAPQKKALLIVAQPKQAAMDAKWESGFEQIANIETFKRDQKHFVLK